MSCQLNGPEAAEEIRKLGYDKPIIGVTGNALQVDQEYFIKTGANKILIKPLNSFSLISTLNELV
jgi:two-component system capsular synthesis sensor histidine kinase RcsC